MVAKRDATRSTRLRIHTSWYLSGKRTKRFGFSRRIGSSAYRSTAFSSAAGSGDLCRSGRPTRGLAFSESKTSATMGVKIGFFGGDCILRFSIPDAACGRDVSRVLQCSIGDRGEKLPALKV